MKYTNKPSMICHKMVNLIVRIDITEILIANNTCATVMKLPHYGSTPNASFWWLAV